MNHLNEDKLIQYAFDLLDKKQHTTSAMHLEQCAECRAKLQQIQKQFAALDALDENEVLSEELIQKTLTQKSVSPKTIPFYRTLWFEWTAVAAAIILIFAVLLQNIPDIRIKDTVPPSAQKPVARLDGPEPGLTESLQSHPVQSEESPVPTTAEADRRIQEVKILDLDSALNKPPFAPASAIELVVLPKPNTMQLTIYNAEDLTLVRDTRRLTLKPGWNWLQFMWDGTLIDPTSLSLTPLEHADKIDVQQLVYPARLKDVGRWLIRSEVEGAVPFEITYFAAGLNWRAFYMGTMNTDETTMSLKGYVNVANNSGQDFENAQTRLIVGQTRLIEKIPELAQRHYPYGPDIVDDESSNLRYNWNEDNRLWWRNRGIAPTQTRFAFELYGDYDGFGGGGFGGGRVGGDLYFNIKQIEKEGLSEYFLYTIEGTEDLPNTWAKRLPSFDVNDIPIKSLYKYDEDRYGSNTVRFISFANDHEHELGETPIPEGSIKIYRNLNDAQNLSYIGESAVKYIPVNEDVELNLGPARLMKVEPILMQTQTDNYTFGDKHNITGWDTIETWQMKLTNTREIGVDLEITRNFGTDYWDIDVDALDNVEYKKHDKTRARFELTLPARAEQRFSYTVTKYEGARSEAYIKQLQEQEE